MNMEDITIYKQDGTALLTAPITDDSSRQWQLMGENHVRLVWNSGTYTPLPAKSYIEYKGERFTLLETYYPEKKVASHYAYDVKFQSVERLFVRNIFFRHVTVGETTWREPEFTLNSNLKTIADIIIDSLNSAAFGVTFSLPDGNTYADTGLKALSFSGVSLYDALTYIAEQWETEWWIEDGTVLHFDRCEHGDIIELGDGYTESPDGTWESAGLLSVPQSTSDNIPQRVYAYGSKRNMTRRTTEDGGMNVSYAKRLRLDSTAYPGGYIEVENVTSGIEEVKMFDDIYPRRVGTLSSVRSVEQDGMTVWYVADAEIPSLFDPKEQAIPGTTMMMKFESGYLNGFEFEVNWHPENGEWEIINRQDDDVQIPFGSLVPRTGDTYSLFNIVMPEEYISLAQEELAAAAQEYVDGLAATVPETTCESEPLYWQRYGVTVEVGSRVRITGGTSDDGKVIDSRVTALSYSLTDPCSVQFTLSSGRATGRLAQMADTIAEQTAQIDGLRQTARAVSRNSWQSSQELSRMLDSLMKELVLVGSEEGQFVMSSGVTWDNSQSTLTVTKGKLVHTVYDMGTQHGQWTVQQASFDLTQPQYSDDTPYYIYIRCSVSTDAATVLLSASKKEVDGESGYYCFLAGILSSKYLGSRVYNSVSGLTQIAGGTITTQILQDPSRNLIIDFSSVPPRIIARNGAVFQGKVTFTSGTDAEETIQEALDIASGAQQSADEAYSAASDAQSSANAAQSTADDALSAASNAQDYIDSTLPSQLQSINAKLDGVVENWYEPYTPTRSNAPASTWIANGEEAAHEGDTFTNTQEYVDDATTPDAGKSWRWVKGTGGAYSWTPIADSDAVKALQQAARAQDTADQKRRVFVVTPSTPYDVGDLWTQGTNGRTMRCVKARATGAYTASDWDYADNSQEYTDKSIASIEIGGTNLLEDSQKERSATYNQAFIRIPVSVEKMKELKGKDVTISLKIKGTGTTPKCVMYILGLYDGGKDYYTSTYQHTAEENYETIDFTGVVADLDSLNITSAEFSINVKYGGASSDTTIYIKEVKLEQGNKPTAWSPAPEDLEEATREAQQAADNANTAISSLNNDSIFSIVEKKTVRTEWEAISGLANTSHTTTGSGSYKKALDAATAVKVSTTNLTTAYNNLKSNLNANKLYTAEDTGGFSRTVMSEKFRLYYNEEIAVTKAVQDAYTNSEVDGIQIGGRNLIAKRYLTDWNSVAAGITEKGSDDNGDYLLIDHNKLFQNIGGQTAYNDIFQGKVKYKENTQYAFRIKWRKSSANATNGMYIGVKYSDGSTEWLSVLSHADADIIEEGKVTRAGKTVAAFITTFGTSAIKSIIYEIQLTEGTKQTAGWLVAPEDVNEKIDSLPIPGENLISNLSGNWTQGSFNENGSAGTRWDDILWNSANSIRTRETVPVSGSIAVSCASGYKVGFLQFDASGGYLGISTYDGIAVPPFTKELDPRTAAIGVAIFRVETAALTPAEIGSVCVKIEKGTRHTEFSLSPSDERTVGYITSAMGSKTDVVGGVILTNLIGLRNTSTNEATGGMSGIDDNIAFWSGGTYAEAVSAADKSDQDVMPTLPVLLTKKGYGSNIGIFKVRQDDIAVLNSGVKTIISKKTLKEAIILMPIFRNDFDDAAFTLKGTWSKLATTPPRKTSYVDYTWISTTKQRAVIRVRGSLKASGNGGGTPGVALCLASFSCWIKEGTATTGKVVWYPKGAGFSTTGYTTVSDFGGAQESLRTKEFEFRASVELKANTRYSYYIGLSELTINGTGTITLDCSVEAYFDRIGDCCVICNDGMGIVAGGNRFFLQQETGKEDLTIIADLPDASASLQPGQMYNDGGTVKIK